VPTHRLRYQALHAGYRGGAKLRRSCLVLAVLTLLSTSPALGQYLAVAAACRRDILHVCPGARPGGEKLARCIRANFQTFTEACQAALLKKEPVFKACAADVARVCPGIKPGSGRKLLCVRARYAALSEPCREAIGHAALRRITPAH